MPDGKWIAGLHAEMPAADAARVVLAARFETVRQGLPLAVEQAYEDVEHVHQLRVGTRRAGAALAIFADRLPKKHHKAAKTSLRSLRRAAGEARDWDVFILGLRDAKPLAAVAGKPARDFLLGYALAHRTTAQDKLAEAAAEDGPRFVAESTALPDHVYEEGSATFGDVATDHLGQLLAAFTDTVRSGPTEPAALHRLRIEAKQLRYAIEIFSGCFTPPLKDAIYPVVEDVQDLLGSLQDAAVGIERLEAIRDRTQRVSPDEWARVRTGITGLIRGLRLRQTTGRRKFETWRKQWEGIFAAHPLEEAKQSGPVTP